MRFGESFASHFAILLIVRFFSEFCNCFCYTECFFFSIEFKLFRVLRTEVKMKFTLHFLWIWTIVWIFRWQSMSLPKWFQNYPDIIRQNWQRCVNLSEWIDSLSRLQKRRVEFQCSLCYRQSQDNIVHAYMASTLASGRDWDLSESVDRYWTLYKYHKDVSCSDTPKKTMLGNIGSDHVKREWSVRIQSPTLPSFVT